MTIPEIAEALEISPRSADRHWHFARAWLKGAIRGHDAPGLVPILFSEDGNYLAARKGVGSLLVWKVETGQTVASIEGPIRDAAFAAGGRVLVVAKSKGNDHEIGFYDLAHADLPPRWVPGKNHSRSLAVSPDGGLVASSTDDGLVRLFDPAKGEWIESLHGHLNSVFKVAFSSDGRRLISTSGGREAVKL